MKKVILFIATLVILFSSRAEKRAYHFYHDIVSSRFVSIYPESDPWILTPNKLLMRYEKSKWKVVEHHYKFDFDTLKVDSKNKVWAMKKYGDHLYFLENNTWDSIPFNDTMQQATTFNIDRNGIPYVVASGGIWRFEDGEFKRIIYRNADSSLVFFSGIVFDTKNNGYAYRGTTLVVNPHLNPIRFDFLNAGLFIGMDKKKNIYFWKDNKLSVYHDSNLVKQIAPPTFVSYSTIYINDQSNVYFLLNNATLHYDGTQFKVDSNAKGIINRLGYIDKAGLLWKTTNKELIMKSGDSIISLTPRDLGLRSPAVTEVVKQGEDYLITYADSLPTLFQKGKYIHYDSTYIQMPLRNILQGLSGELWAKGKDTLYQYKNKKWSKLIFNGSGVYVDALCRTNQGGIAFFSKDKLIFMNAESTSVSNFPFKPFLPPWSGGAIITQDKNGVIWLSLNKQGLYRFENNIWTEYNEENTPKMNTPFIFSMSTDTSNYLYGACAIGGLLRYDGEKFRILDTTNSNTNFNSKVSIGIDHNNKVWCGDYEKGMEYFDGVNFHLLDIDFNHQIHRTWVDDNNDKWFFSQGHISIYNERDEPTPPIPPVPPMSETISFYPNPANESITIQNLLSDDRIQILDLTGRKLVDYKPGKEGDQVVSLDAISRGLYLLNIDRKNQAYFQAKVLKE